MPPKTATNDSASVVPRQLPKHHGKRSKRVLTIADNPNGLLNTSEIAQLKLDADWVLLSACNTAAEEQPGTEALSVLARAFFYAGARSLLVSHWIVDDEAAARLMVGTFRALSRDAKLSHAKALRQSMLATMSH